MKNPIKSFMKKITKNYGEKFDIKNLYNGQKVKYSGEPCEVVESSEYIAILRSLNDKELEFKVNQSMFNKKGFI